MGKRKRPKGFFSLGYGFFCIVFVLIFIYSLAKSSLLLMKSRHAVYYLEADHIAKYLIYQLVMNSCKEYFAE